MEYRKYIASEAWNKVRQERYKIDEGKCQCCGRFTDGKYHTHHLNYSHLGYEKMEDVITLCPRCHDLIHALTDTIKNNILSFRTEIMKLKDEIYRTCDKGMRNVNSEYFKVLSTFIMLNEKKFGGDIDFIKGTRANRFAERVNNLMPMCLFDEFDEILGHKHNLPSCGYQGLLTEEHKRRKGLDNNVF